MNQQIPQEYPLPQLTVSCGAAYVSKPSTGDGTIYPDIRIILMDREEPATAPVERDAYLHAIVKACNSYQRMKDALSIALGFVVAVKIARQTNVINNFSKLPPPFSVETVIRDALKPKEETA